MPVTRAASSAGRLLGSGSITSNATSTANFASPTDVAGLSTTVTTTGGIRLVFSGQKVANDTVTDGVFIYLVEDSTVKAVYNQDTAVAAEGISPHREVYYTPTVGPHTFKIQMARVSAGTVTLTAAGNSPAQIAVFAT